MFKSPLFNQFFKVSIIEVDRVLPVFTTNFLRLTLSRKYCRINEWTNEWEMKKMSCVCRWNMGLFPVPTHLNDVWKSLLVARTRRDFCKLINWTFNSLFSCTVYSIYISNYWICMYKWMQLQSLRYFFLLDLLNLNEKIGLKVALSIEPLLMTDTAQHPGSE